MHDLSASALAACQNPAFDRTRWCSLLRAGIAPTPQHCPMYGLYAISKSREHNPILATLQQKGYRVDKVSDAIGASRQWTEDLHQRKPDLLWIVLHQPTTKQGSRADRRQHRKEVDAAEAQSDDGRTCVIEGLSDNSSWQFEMIQDMRTADNWKAAEIALCNLGACGRNGQPTKRKLHVLTNITISLDPHCHCGQDPEKKKTCTTSTTTPWSTLVNSRTA